MISTNAKNFIRDLNKLDDEASYEIAQIYSVNLETNETIPPIMFRGLLQPRKYLTVKYLKWAFGLDGSDLEKNIFLRRLKDYVITDEMIIITLRGRVYYKKFVYAEEKLFLRRVQSP